MGDHAILLVVVAQNHQPRAHPPTDGLDPLAEQGVVEAAVGRERSGGLRVGKEGGHADRQYTWAKGCAGPCDLLRGRYTVGPADRPGGSPWFRQVIRSLFM